jgi:hypothetical protein
MADQLTSDELRQVLADWISPYPPKQRRKIAGLFEAVIARAEAAEADGEAIRRLSATRSRTGSARPRKRALPQADARGRTWRNSTRLAAVSSVLRSKARGRRSIPPMAATSRALLT